ncbi:MAG: amidohydrolase family protein [Spirochaetales bacterium]|nr:amidohydrolase family protein [Spirochaetales bacterium]
MAKTILFTDAIIHTMQEDYPLASSMLVQKGRIVALDPRNVKRAKIVSLKGQHVYPCLIDSHLHLLPTLVAFTGFKLSTITEGKVLPSTLKGVENKIREFSSKVKKGELVIITNYIITAIKEQRLPTKEELDLWCDNKAVAIYTIDGHSSALSTKMLEKLSINTVGHIGILQGIEHESIQGRLTNLIASSVTVKMLAKGVAGFHNACAKYGISAVGALEGNGDSEKDLTTKLIIQLARRFKVSVYLYLQYFDIKKALPLIKYQATPRLGGCGDWEMDGAIGAHSAAFSTPYKDTGKIAKVYKTQKDVDKTVQEANSLGFQIASHAIGEEAIKLIVKAFSTIKDEKTNRIEHCEFPTDKEIEEISKHNYALVMQPGYSWLDKRYLHTYSQFLSTDTLKQLKLKTLFDKNIIVCGSSDSPVQDLDPWFQMMGMKEYYNEEESISNYEALKSYTVNAAKALRAEEDRGQLKVKAVADFFTSKQDIFTLSAQELCDFRPKDTYYGGKVTKTLKSNIVGFLLIIFNKPHKI